MWRVRCSFLCVLATVALLLPACGGAGGFGGGGGVVLPPGSQIVTNLNDSGPGSLRQAIEDASPGGWVIFDSNLAAGPIHLLSYLEIDKNIEIGGLSSGGQRFILDGGNATRLFVVQPASSLVLRDFILRHGFAGPAGNGGAILAVSASLTLERVQFVANHAPGGLGGAMAVIESTLHVYDSAFTANTAEQGGGVYARNTDARVERSSFHLNSALDGAGGGLYLQSSFWQMVNSTLNDNEALGGLSRGGGLYARTTNMNGPGRLWLWACTITDNTALFGGGVTLDEAPSPAAWCDLISQYSIVADNGALAARDLNFLNGATGSGSFNVMGVGDGVEFLDGVNGNQAGTLITPLDPLLEPVAFHAGGRAYRRPTAGSPAVDAVPAGGMEALAPGIAFLFMDQRGPNRTPLLAGDAGAIER